MNNSDQSLRSLFELAKQKQKAVESHPDPSALDYAETLQLAVRKYEECLDMIQRLSLFSSNETLDEIATTDIRYLATEYYLAQLMSRSSQLDRQRTLRRVCELYDGFLERLREYDLLSAPNRKLYERFSRDPATFSLAALNDTAERRSVKIARLQEEKALKSKLQILQESSYELNVDDEVLRKIHLAELELYANKSFTDLDLLSRELAMLEKAPRNPPDMQHDARSRSQESYKSYSDRLDRPVHELSNRGRGPMLDAKGRPLQPFTIMDKRSQLRSGVFKPGHNLPTMSIDEYLEEEKKRGGILEGGNQDQPPAYDEDDMKQADEETMKARAWDEFTESNPKGSGNTLNRG